MNGHCGSTSRTFIVEDYAENEFGHGAIDEVTGEQGYIDDERSCFWRWDDNEYTWQSKPFKSRQVIRREGAYPQSGVSAFESPSEAWPDDPSISDPPWFHMSHSAWMASVLLNLANHPTHVVLDIGCTRSIGSRAATKRFQKVHCFVALLQNFARAISPLCLPTLLQKLAWKVVLFIFRQHIHARPESMYLRRATCLSYSPFLTGRIWVRLLNWIQEETKLHVQLLACTLLRSNSPNERDILCRTQRVLRISPNRVTVRFTRRDVSILLYRNENQRIQLAHENWTKMKMISLWFAQPARPLLKTKITSPWCNLHQEMVEEKKVNLAHNAEFVHLYEEQDLESGEIHLPH